jgi:hypothetical protein
MKKHKCIKHVISSIICGCFFIACAPKPSDSDVGRHGEADGFHVKTFMIAKCNKLSPKIIASLKVQMKYHELSFRESVTSSTKKTIMHMSSDESKMIEIFKKKGKAYKVYLEGSEEFINPVTDKFPKSFSTRHLINAKKIFYDDPITIQGIVARYIKQHALENEFSMSSGEHKEEEAKYKEKRIVTKMSNDDITIYIEGELDFVTGLRQNLLNHK